MGVLKRSARNVSRKKSRMALVMMAVSLAMAVMISVPSGIMSNEASVQRLNAMYTETMDRTQKEINLTATLIECTYNSRGETNYLNDSEVSFIRTMAGVAAAVPTLSARLTSDDRFYMISGVPLTTDYVANYDILPTNLTSGRNLVPGDFGVVVIDKTLADNKSLAVDSTLTLNGTAFKVIGIYSPDSFTSQRPTMFMPGSGTGEPPGGWGGASGGQPPGGFPGERPQGQMFMRAGSVYMSIYDAQKLFELQGKVNQLDVYAANISYVDTIASYIEANFTSLSVTTPKDRLARLQTMTSMFTTTLANSKSQLASMQSMAYQEIALALAATGAIVFITMLYSVRERTREIGILKAIGFSRSEVMKQFVAEALIICVVAGVVGVVIGNIAAPFLSSALLPSSSQQTGAGPGGRGGFRVGFTSDAGEAATVVTPDPWMTLLAFTACLLLGIVGSLYPAWKASRTSPMEALRYE